ncbi:hypothetical protein B932_3130 [Gluconobacter oxydans H24]|nr:hypothetical protein B932_3130 [Gluconobacter oxydans H24]
MGEKTESGLHCRSSPVCSDGDGAHITKDMRRHFRHLNISRAFVPPCNLEAEAARSRTSHPENWTGTLAAFRFSYRSWYELARIILRSENEFSLPD